MFYLILKHSHSVLRWLVLAILILAVVRSLYYLIKPYNGGTNNRIPNLLLIFVNIQVVLGIILYVISPKVIFSSHSMSNHLLRFYLVEHIALMLIATAIISIGVARSKRAVTIRKKHTQLFLFLVIGLALMFLAIPWPWRPLSAGWF